MKKYIAITLILLFINSQAQNYINLSDSAQISITTCSPGYYLYNTFGHSTIRVKDTQHNIDYIFHYGTFNFQQKHFYWNFIKGKLNYMLSVQTFNGFEDEYSAEGRNVWQLTLNLNKNQKQKIFNYLMWKSLPENKYYLYDFFYDNCATRVRDVFVKFLKDSLIYPQKKINLTYRQAIKPYLNTRPWLRLGINLLLGLPADQQLTTYSAAFLPDYLDTLFMNSAIKTPQNNTKPLIKKKELIINSGFQLGKEPLLNPINIFLILLLIISIVSFYEVKKEKNYRWIEFTWLLLSGLIGIIILFMWFGTDHSPTKNNLNILWALPFNIIFAFAAFKKQTPNICIYYCRFLTLYYILFLLFWIISPQKFDTALLPLIIIFVVRGLLFFIKPLRKIKFNI